MRIDHVCYAAEPDGMAATAARLGERLGVAAHNGGVHPRFGTRNMILPLAQDRYVEVVEVLEHPAADKAPFGQAVRARSAAGGGWLAWVVAVEALTPIEERLGRPSVEGNRHTPEGVELTWRQIGVKDLMADQQLPFFVRWDSMDHHPSHLEESPARLSGLRICGDAERIRGYLGLQAQEAGSWEDGVSFDVEPGTPRLDQVVFETASGRITI